MQENKKYTNRGIDNEGIRLAPEPSDVQSARLLAPVVQPYVIVPHVEMEKKAETPMEKKEKSTAKDYQPKKADITPEWKKKKKVKNVLIGLVMLIFTTLMLLPYILGFFENVNLDNLPFVYIYSEFNVGVKLVALAKDVLADHSLANILVLAKASVPVLLLAVGIIALVVNFIKSLVGLFGAVKPVKYLSGGVFYLLVVLVIFIFSLVGFTEIGFNKVEPLEVFMNFKSSEIFSLLATSVAYTIVCAICKVLNHEKFGYL